VDSNRPHCSAGTDWSAVQSSGFGVWRSVFCNSRILRNIVAYVASENPSAAETLGSDLLGQAIRLESLPHRDSRVKKRRDLLKLIHGQYLIYYGIREEEKVVEIVAFKH
jgi:plasmid stabilization system protein ParE